MKKFLAGLILGLILATTAAAVAAPQAIRLIVNGKEVPSDPSPMMYQDRVFVPVRFVAEALGADVKWDDKTQAVTITQQVVQPVAALVPSSDIIEQSNSVVPKGGDSVPQPEIQMFTVINEKLGISAPYEDVILHSPDMVYLSLRGIWIATGLVVDFNSQTKKISIFGNHQNTELLAEYEGAEEFSPGNAVVTGDRSSQYFVLLSELQDRGIITSYQADPENKKLTITTP